MKHRKKGKRVVWERMVWALERDVESTLWRSGAGQKNTDTNE